MSTSPYRIIPLTKGFVAIIDAKHFRRVNRHSWRVHMSAGTKKKHGQPYARATIGGKDVYLHRFIKSEELAQRMLSGSTDREESWHVDHRNRQTLDCRDENLEVVHYIVNLRRQRRGSGRKRKVADVGTQVADNIKHSVHNRDVAGSGIEGRRLHNDCDGLDVSDAFKGFIGPSTGVDGADVDTEAVVDVRIQPTTGDTPSVRSDGGEQQQLIRDRTGTT